MVHQIHIMDDTTPRPETEMSKNVTAPNEDEIDHDPFLAQIAAEDAQPVASGLSVVDSDKTNVSLYEWEMALARRRRSAIAIATVLIVIAAPFLYLFLNGKLRGVRDRPLPVADIPSVDARRGTKTPIAKTSPHAPTAKEEHQAAVAADLHDYLWNSVKANSSDEVTALSAYASVTGMRFKDDATLFQTVKQVVLPQYTAFAEKMNYVQPRTSEVQALHRKLLAMVALRLKAYQDIAAAENGKSGIWQYVARDEFTRASALQADYQKAVVQKSHELGVDLP